MEKPKHMSQEGLEAIIETIDSILSVPLDAEDGNAISARIGDLVSLMSSSATAVATAERIYNEGVGEILTEMYEKKSATEKKLILAGRLSEQQYWLKQAERQNAALVHAVDGLRSMLSYLKQEMILNSQYSPDPR